jgi:hypothetical protein
LLKIGFLCLGLLLAAEPLAAVADDAPPTPAPPEHFLNVDGAVTGKTYNELAPGTSTGAFGIRAAAEVPVIGHNWVAQIDFRSYNYQHKAGSVRRSAFRERRSTSTSPTWATAPT